MNRKLLIFLAVLILVGLSLLAWSLGKSLFQPAEEEKVYKVAVVLLGGAYNQAVNGLKDGMRSLGYTEGENIFYYVKDTQGNQEAIVPSAEELLWQNPDVFYTVSTPVTTRVWNKVGQELPIVFNIVGDPIGAGFAKNYLSSETNLTGCSNLSAELSGKRLEVFKEAFPQLKKVVTFYDPDNKFSQLSITNTRTAVPNVGVEVREIHVKNIDELKTALAALKPGGQDGIFLTPDAMVISQAELVVARAKELDLPVMGHEESLAQKGVTLTYGADFYKLGVQCAQTLLAVLQGQNPQDVSIQTPRELDIVINLKAVQELGLSVFSEFLQGADKVIR